MNGIELRNKSFNEFKTLKGEYESTAIKSSDSYIKNNLMTMYTDILDEISNTLNIPKNTMNFQTVQNFDGFLYGYWVEIHEQLHFHKIKKTSIKDILDNLEYKVMWMEDKAHSMNQ